MHPTLGRYFFPLQNKVPFLPFSLPPTPARRHYCYHIFSTTNRISSFTTTKPLQERIKGTPSFLRLAINDTMAGGKGKSIGGKGSGAKDSGSKSQKSHSAKAGLQVRCPFVLHQLFLIDATMHLRFQAPSTVNLSLGTRKRLNAFRSHQAMVTRAHRAEYQK